MARKDNSIEQNPKVTVVKINKPRFTKKTLLFMVFGVIITVVASLLWYFYINRHKSIETEVYEQITYDFSRAQDEQRTSDSIPDLLTYLSSNPINKAEKQRAQIMLSSAYQNQQDYENAKKWLILAIQDQEQPQYASYVSLAEMDELMENKTMAVENYKKALEILNQYPDQNSAGYETYIKSRISALEGS